MIVTLADQPFEPGALVTAFCADRQETGAVATFVGLARAERGQAVALELEAYPGFTDAAIGEIAQAAIDRFKLHDVHIVHRVGRIAPGEAIVFVAAAARHRREAFEAADFMMDYLKSRAPFWKKETGEDGSRWIEPSTRDRDDATRWD